MAWDIVLMSLIVWSSHVSTIMVSFSISLANVVLTFNVNSREQCSLSKRGPFTYTISIVNYLFVDGDVPMSPFFGIYISQLVRFARVCNNI